VSNLTITVDDEVLKRARIRALEQGTSVNAVLRDVLEAYAGIQPEQREAVRSLLSQARASAARRGGARWSREELHERR
jgi:plasmid stability protein